jgi:hypothetical protein
VCSFSASSFDQAGLVDERRAVSIINHGAYETHEAHQRTFLNRLASHVGSSKLPKHQKPEIHFHGYIYVPVQHSSQHLNSSQPIHPTHNIQPPQSHPPFTQALASPPVAPYLFSLSIAFPRSPITPAEGTAFSCMLSIAALAGSFLVPTSPLKLAFGADSSKEETSVMFLPWGLPVSTTA